MNMKKQNTRKKALPIKLASILLLVIGCVVYVVFFTNRDPTTNYNPQYPKSISDNNKSAGDNTNDSTKTTPPALADKTSEDIPVSRLGAVEITNLNQKDGYVNALATITNFSASKCVYLFESDGARPIAREQIGGCSGISIPEVEFEKIGNYTLNVTVYTDTNKITASKDISIR